MKKYISKTKIYICLALIIFSTIILPVNALAIDRDFYAGNDILFFDKDAKSTNCLDSGSDTGDGNLAGKNRREQIWCYLTTVKGFSKGGAAGAIGNMARETGSTWQPDLWQKGGICDGDKKYNANCGYGLLQWSNLDFKKDLWKSVNETFPNTSGKVGTLKVQLDFMVHSFSTDTDSDVGQDLIKLLKNDSTTPAEAAWQILNWYNCRPQYCGGSSIICESCALNQDTSAPEAKKAFEDFKNLNCGGASPPTTTNNSSTSSTKKPKILIGPGHTGNMESTFQWSGNPKIKDVIYGNKPELQDVWDVAQIVKPALEKKGYEVLMTKNSVGGTPYSWDRSQQANNNNVDLAFEIHTSSPSGGFSDWGQTWSQFKGGYRVDKDGNNFNLVASDSVIAKSKEYAAKFTAARKAAGEKNVETKSEAGFYNASNPSGNITLVQLWSEVPWIYLEAGANKSKDGGNSGGITDAQKDIYAKGIIDGVVASIPPGSTQTSDGCDSSSPTTGSGDASAIVDWALKLSWDDAKSNHGKYDAKPLYIEWQDKIVGKGQSYGYAACNVFVATVMRASEADPKYPTSVVSNPLPGSQLDYIRKHPDLYEKVDNPSTTKNLKPGDILIIVNMHTGIFVGDQVYGNTRESALDDHVPGADTVSWYPSYGELVVYRLK